MFQLKATRSVVFSEQLFTIALLRKRETGMNIVIMCFTVVWGEGGGWEEGVRDGKGWGRDKGRRVVGEEKGCGE